MTLGLIAEIKIVHPKALETPLLHRIPAEAMNQRWRVALGLKPLKGSP